MKPSSVFQLCNTIALIGWLILILTPFWFQSDKFILGIIVTLFCIGYTWLVFSHFNFGDLRKFGSLDGVMELFTKKEIVAAGWVHYLAFAPFASAL